MSGFIKNKRRTCAYWGVYYAYLYVCFTLSLKTRIESRVWRFCSNKAVPAEYRFTSSNCSTATATQNRALCMGESCKHTQGELVRV